MEEPLYILKPHTPRVIIPTATALTILGIIFYFGILLNISLLQLTGAQETTIKTAALLLLLAIIIFGIFLSWHKKQSYLFFRSFLQIQQKNIPYVSMNIQKKQNFLDKLFYTYSLDLGSKIILKNIPEEIDLATYLTQLRQYGQGRY